MVQHQHFILAGEYSEKEYPA